MNILNPMPVNFRFITKQMSTTPVFYKKINAAFYVDRDLKINAFYKPILFVA
jgi:hypothetical protein